MINKIKNELIKTVGNGLYNGWNNRTTFGYHSYNIGDIEIVGQRNPKIRLDILREHINFDNKKVIDFGCNVGAMLHHLHEIGSGIGFDYDIRCIDAANNISGILDRRNIEFHKHDFDINSYDDLIKKINFNPDIILLLSIGSWVKSWKKLYEICIGYDCNIILETNNDIEGKDQLDLFRDNDMTIELISPESIDDSTGNYGRKTYLINGSK